MEAHLARLRQSAQIAKLVAQVTEADRERVLAGFGEKCRALGQRLEKGSLKELGQNVACMFRMLIDRRFALSWGTTAAIVFALGYFISPVDVIPDAAAVVGYLDDALVVAEIAYLVSGDIARYRALSSPRQTVTDSFADRREGVARAV